MLKKILTSKSGSKNGADRVYFNGNQVYKAYVGSSLVYDVTNGKDFNYTYNSSNQKFSFIDWKQTTNEIPGFDFLVADDPTIVVSKSAITNKNTYIHSISIPYNVPILDGNLSHIFSNCTNLKSANIYSYNVTNMYHTFSNCSNLTGPPICGNNVKSMYHTYHNCVNLTGQPVCGPNVTTMVNCYQNCQSLTGTPVCGSNVTSMNYAYYNCTNLTGDAVCGNKVTYMYRAYENCYSLTGNPACGNSVTNMLYAYRNCYNLTGSPSISPLVEDISNTYYNCYNLSGSPVCTNKVHSLIGTYYECRNLTGCAKAGTNVINMANAYYNCANLSTNAYMFGTKMTSANRAFGIYNNTRDKALNIYIQDGSTTATTFKQNTAATSITGTAITWTDDTVVNGCYSNTSQNIYLYPVSNVADYYKENELLLTRYTVTNTSSAVPQIGAYIKEFAIDNANYIKPNQFDLGFVGSIDNVSTDEYETYTSKDDNYYEWYNFGEEEGLVVRIRDDGTAYAFFDAPSIGTTYVYVRTEGEVIEITTESIDNGDGTKTVNIYSVEEDIYPNDVSFNGMTDLLSIEKLKSDKITNADYMFAGCSNLTLKTQKKELKKIMTTGIVSGEFYELYDTIGTIDNFKYLIIENVEYGKSEAITIDKFFDYGHYKQYESDKYGIDILIYVNSGMIEYDTTLYPATLPDTIVTIFYEEDEEKMYPTKLKFDNLITANNMFYGCYNLEYIDMSDINTTNLKLANRMFKDCSKLKNHTFEDYEYDLEAHILYSNYNRIFVGEDIIEILKFEKEDGTLSPYEWTEVDTTGVIHYYCKYNDIFNYYAVYDSTTDLNWSINFTVDENGEYPDDSIKGRIYAPRQNLVYTSQEITLAMGEEVTLEVSNLDFDWICTELKSETLYQTPNNYTRKIIKNENYTIYYIGESTKPIQAAVNNNGNISLYYDGPGITFKLYFYKTSEYTTKKTFELPNIESAVGIFDGCTNLK